MTASLTHHDEVSVLDLGDDENRFTTARLADVETALDEVASVAPPALITTASCIVTSSPHSSHERDRTGTSTCSDDRRLVRCR